MSVKTKIQVVLEIESDSTWPDECTVAQIRKQSMDGAMVAINRTLERGMDYISVLGDPKCISINFSEDK